MKQLDQALADRFICVKCNSRGGYVKRIAATGTGLSKMFDIQHNKFIAVSCGQCGFTELYNPQFLEKGSRGGDILDVLFG